MSTESLGSARQTRWSVNRAGGVRALTTRSLGFRRVTYGAAAVLTSALFILALSLPASATSGPRTTAATATATATRTFDWGRPTASGGPGLSPTRVGVSGETAIDAGNDSDLAIMPGESVVGWGTTIVSQPSMTPVPIPKLKHVVQVADGDHSFVVLEAPTGIRPNTCPTDTTVWTWGMNIMNDLGVSSTASVYKRPVKVTSLDGLGVVQVVAASWHMFALTCTGQVYVWGSNASDDLGMGPVANQSKPVINPYLTALTGGTSKGVMLDTGSFAADILVNGKAYGWGNNRQLECGCGTTAGMVSYPRAVEQPVPFTFIDSGGDFDYDGHTLAVDSAGRAWCWGNNSAGQCGLGTTANVSVPTRVPGLPTISTVRAGGQQSIYLDSSGNVWTSGSNEYGESGDGTTTNELRVVKVLSRISMISAGAEHSLAAN